MKAKRKAKAKTKRHVTEALHLQRGDAHVVAVKALQVLLSEDGDGWFAQGLQIDYASCGTSIEEAKKNFEIGLAQTIFEHVKMHGTIDLLLKLAPQEAWQEYLQAPSESIKRYSAITAFQFIDQAVGRDVEIPFPFDEIQFLSKQPVLERAAVSA